MLVPNPLVARDVTVCVPSVSAGLTVQLQAPLPAAVAVQTEPPSTKTSTLLPGSAVPPSVGVLSEVSGGEETEGAPGGVPVTTVKLAMTESALPLPAASAVEARAVCAPSATGAPAMQLHAPPAET